MTDTELATVAEPAAQQPVAVDHSKTAFIASLPFGVSGDRTLTQLARAADMFKATVVDCGNAGTAVAVPPTKRPGAMLYVLTALCPGVTWRLFISGVEIAPELFQLPHGMSVPDRMSPVFDESGIADEALTEAAAAAIQKLGEAYHVLETILRDAIQHDDRWANQGASVEALTERRLELVRGLATLERVAVELTGPQS